MRGYHGLCGGMHRHTGLYMREWVSDRPAQTPSVVLGVASHDSLTVRFLKERTMSVSKHQWWKPRRKKLMTSLTDYTKANTLTIWLQNGYYKLPIHLEYQYSTHLQKSINLNRLVDHHLGLWRPGTGRISSFVDTLLQPIAQKQKSFIKDTTDFISFIEKTKIGNNLVSLDESRLYTNIPKDEGMEIVCKAYDLFHNYNLPIPTCFLR